SKSLADFEQSLLLAPKDAYTWLWRNMAARRVDEPSRLSEGTTKLDMTKWPAPVVRLFLGEISAEAGLAAAGYGKPRTKKGQNCEANFYMGELAMQHGEKDEAARLFRLAVGDCPKGFVEYWTASAELKALEAKQ